MPLPHPLKNSERQCVDRDSHTHAKEKSSPRALHGRESAAASRDEQPFRYVRGKIPSGPRDRDQQYGNNPSHSLPLQPPSDHPSVPLRRTRPRQGECDVRAAAESAHRGTDQRTQRAARPRSGGSQGQRALPHERGQAQASDRNRAVRRRWKSSASRLPDARAPIAPQEASSHRLLGGSLPRGREDACGYR